jgi:protein arginine kinase activator
MICEFCKKNEANVHLIKVINGQTEKLNLCINCLKDFSLIPSEELMNDLSNLLKKVLEVDIKISDKVQSGKVFESIRNQKNKSCGLCGIDLNTVKATGRVGCANCYIEFKNELIPLLDTIHKSHKHIGKIPLRTTKVAKIEKEIRDLEYKLKQEIIVENFEEAAKLRDTIKKLRRNLSVGKRAGN